MFQRLLDMSTTYKNVALIVGLDCTLYQLGLEFLILFGLGQLIIEFSLFIHNNLNHLDH